MDSSQDNVPPNSEKRFKKVFIFSRQSPQNTINVAATFPVSSTGQPPSAAPALPASSTPQPPSSTSLPQSAPQPQAPPMPQASAKAPPVPQPAPQPQVPPVPQASAKAPPVLPHAPQPQVPPVPNASTKAPPMPPASTKASHMPPAQLSAQGPPAPLASHGLPGGMPTAPAMPQVPGAAQGGLVPSLTATAIGGASKDERHTGDSQVQAQYPKVIVTALREKLSYMVNFQMKINNLSKQLKNLMNKTARGGKSKGLPGSQPSGADGHPPDKG
jgi:hypothetical protein